MQLKDLDYPSNGEITIIIHTKLIRGATSVKLVNANSKVMGGSSAHTKILLSQD